MAYNVLLQTDLKFLKDIQFKNDRIDYLPVVDECLCFHISHPELTGAM